jgi:hypothetical protein
MNDKLTIESLKAAASTAGELAIIDVMDRLYRRDHRQLLDALHKIVAGFASDSARIIEEVVVDRLRYPTYDLTRGKAHLEAQLMVDSDRTQRMLTQRVLEEINSVKT